MNARRLIGWIVGGCALVLGLGALAHKYVIRRAHILHPVSGRSVTVPGAEGPGTLLFNGWRIHAVGHTLRTGDMLLGGAVSPDGRTLAIANCGFRTHAVNLFDIVTETLVARIAVPHAGNGIVWSHDGSTLYVSGGVSVSHRDIYVLQQTDGKWTITRTLSLTGNDPKRTVIAGLALTPGGETLYAVNGSDGQLYALDTATGATRFALGCGDHPCVIRIAPNGHMIAVCAWGGSEISLFGTQSDSGLRLVRRIETGAHPNDLVFSRDGRIFVSCGNADSVWVIDPRTGRRIEIVRTALTSHSPSGSTPDALALAPDGRRLYVANADNNDVCVVDVGRIGLSRVLGFIPTGWYPTAVTVSPDGRKLLIASGKGSGTEPNPGTKRPTAPASPEDYGFLYIGNQLNGILSMLSVPDDAALARYTHEVIVGTPYRDADLTQSSGSGDSVIPSKVGAPCPIKHVLYIIKENRTYDQVLGDLPQGNGDPNLTLFGREVTPNHHAIAEQFVLLDNVYCNGEVSQDGHPWCDAGLATDFTQRAWVLYYSGKGSMAGGDDVETPAAGYLWDACKRKGLTYRSYGEAVHAALIRSAPDQQVEGAAGLIGHGSADYVGIGRPHAAGPMRDTEKADVFIKEFHRFERERSIPNFMVMALGEDHTTGTLPGAFTPKASVASNDLALGRIVDAVTHSSAWNSFAIFIIEDDAQNGPDHVDSHRTVCLAISPYIRRHTVDSTMYSTASVLRTMELILGLAPMTQYDAAATPLFASFSNRPDTTPYTAIPAQIDLTAKNPDDAFGAAASRKLDFSAYDRADPNVLNAILWHSIKGDLPMPAPRSALPIVSRLLNQLR